MKLPSDLAVASLAAGELVIAGVTRSTAKP